MIDTREIVVLKQAGSGDETFEHCIMVGEDELDCYFHRCTPFDPCGKRACPHHDHPGDVFP